MFYFMTDRPPNSERRPGSKNTIDFATVVIGGKADPLTFDGATSAALGDGGFRWSDPLKDDQGRPVTLPARSNDLVRTSPSAPEMEAKNFAEVAGNGRWPVGPVGRFADDHPADARVALAHTPDGSHPGSTLHKAGAAIVGAHKANRALP